MEGIYHVRCLKIEKFPPIIVVGNKSDSEQRRISAAEVQTWLKNFPSPKIRYIETSAKTGENVDDLFNAFGEHAKSVQVVDTVPEESVFAFIKTNQALQRVRDECTNLAEAFRVRVSSITDKKPAAEESGPNPPEIVGNVSPLNRRKTGTTGSQQTQEAFEPLGDDPDPFRRRVCSQGNKEGPINENILPLPSAESAEDISAEEQKGTKDQPPPFRKNSKLKRSFYAKHKAEDWVECKTQ